MWFTDYMVTPWCRAGPYLIGIAIGIYLHGIKLRTHFPQVQLRCSHLIYRFDVIAALVFNNVASSCHVSVLQLQKLVFGVLALFFLIAPAYGTYARFKDGLDRWTKPQQVMYDTFARSTWALGVAWFIVVCSTGNAGA